MLSRAVRPAKSPSPAHFSGLRTALFLWCVLLVSGCESEPQARMELRAGSASERSAALSLVTTFLRLIDAGKSADTHQLLSDALKAEMSALAWQQLVEAMHVHGAVEQREVFAAGFTSKLANAPVAEYFVADHQTQFQLRSAIERVVLVKTGKRWVVGGYYLSVGNP